jgi:hypothetical protein
MSSIVNIIQAISLYTEGTITRSSLKIVDGKFQPSSIEQFNYMLNVYNIVLSNCHYTGDTWTQKIVNNAYRCQMQKYRDFLEHYPIYEWDTTHIEEQQLGSLFDNTIIL